MLHQEVTRWDRLTATNSMHTSGMCMLSVAGSLSHLFTSPPKPPRFPSISLEMHTVCQCSWYIAPDTNIVQQEQLDPPPTPPSWPGGRLLCPTLSSSLLDLPPTTPRPPSLSPSWCHACDHPCVKLRTLYKDGNKDVPAKPGGWGGRWWWVVIDRG